MHTSTLKMYFVSFLIIASIVMVQPVFALEPSFSAAVNETVETPSSWIATAAEFVWNQQSLGFFSSTCGTKAIVFEGVSINMLPDLVNYRNVNEVKLIARNTQGVVREYVVPKEDIKLANYLTCVDDLTPGEWTFLWEIKSKDKAQRYGVLFIKLTIMGNRSTAASLHITVQSAPDSIRGLSKEQAFAFVRGLIPAWATPDPGYMAQRQAVSQMMPQLQSEAQSVVVPSNPPINDVEEVAPRPRTRPEPAPDDGSFTERDDSQPDSPARPRIVEPRRAVTISQTTVYLSAGSVNYRIQKVHLEGIQRGDTLVIKRGKSVLKARVTGVINDDIYSILTSGDTSLFRLHDNISVEKGKGK